MNDQKSFFAKMFIYEKLSELEKDFSVTYAEYIPKLNTGSYDEEPKNVEQLLDTYGSTYLKTDPEFRITMKALKKLEIATDFHKLDDTSLKSK